MSSTAARSSSPTTSPTLRRIVSSVLTREGYEVIVATDGIGTIQAVFREQANAVALGIPRKCRASPGTWPRACSKRTTGRPVTSRCCC